MMPEMDGIELCKTLKSDERTSHIPIIVLTAKSDEESTIKGLEAGADDYFIKPVSTAKLHIRIEKLIELREKLRNIYNSKMHVSPSELALTSMDEQFLEKVQLIVDNEMFNQLIVITTFPFLRPVSTYWWASTISSIE